ncbi:unnamed protein product [Amaranthus hypochondriacus]
MWVANRENPVKDLSGVLKISRDGYLQVVDGQNKSIWSSNVKSKIVINTSVVQLLDTGNLVISDVKGNILWQSFDHPENSMLPHMKLTFDGYTNTSLRLSSWMSASDPSYGRFTAGINQRKLSELFIWYGDRPYWRSGPWDGHVFMGVRSMYYFAPVKEFHFDNDNVSKVSLAFSSVSEGLMRHYVLNSDGIVFQKEWKADRGDWTVVCKSLESNTECDIFGKCGEFGICNSNNLPICSCLRGFEPRNFLEWKTVNWSRGCVRRTPLQWGNSTGEEDWFLRLRNMKVPDNGEWLYSDDEQDCRRHCLRHHSCLAYAYYLGFGCLIWSESLVDIQDFSPVGVDLYIRLASSELGDTGKWKVILALIVIMGSAAGVVLLYYIRRWMGQSYGKKTNEETQWLKSYMDGAGFSDIELQELPLFRFKDLVVATNEFSDRNKLGQGGFGLVYKVIIGFY